MFICSVLLPERFSDYYRLAPWALNLMRFSRASSTTGFSQDSDSFTGILTEYNKEYMEMNGDSTIYLSLTNEKFWPKDILQQWMETYDRAEEKIASLKESDPALHQAYLERSQKEKLSTLYLFVECYSYNTNAVLIEAYTAEFKELADKFSVTKHHESNDISILYDKWF